MNKNRQYCRYDSNCKQELTVEDIFLNFLLGLRQYGREVIQHMSFIPSTTPRPPSPSLLTIGGGGGGDSTHNSAKRIIQPMLLEYE
jgi:hypothetical protein